MCPTFRKSCSEGAEYNTTTAVADPLTLSNCPELRELEINAWHPGTVELDLISSITSTNIRKITFTQSLAPNRPTVPDHPNWTRLDNSLCRLVDRSECGLRLEVGFRAADARAWWNGSWASRSICQGFTRRVRPAAGGENDSFFPIRMGEAAVSREVISKTCIPGGRYSDPCSRSWWQRHEIYMTQDQ